LKLIENNFVKFQRVILVGAAHHIVCECPAIKSIRVILYRKPLLPEEVMEEPLWKIARFATETGLLKRGGTTGQA